MAAVPSIGRASRVERPAAPGAEAARDLYERYSAQIFGYCFHQLGSREEAEDAVQTTFMNAFRGLARGIVPEVEQAWVFKIAHNVCLSRRRSSWRRGRIEAPNNMEVLQEVVPAKEKVADELIRLQDVLEDMPESQRRAILLREWQGLSYREIADELELSQAAVETLIFRARRALASGLEEAPAEGGWRKRLRRAADVGGALAFLKTFVGGGGAAAIKIATVVALAGATVAATAGGRMWTQHHVLAKTPAHRTPPAAERVTTLPSAPSVRHARLVSAAFVSVARRRHARAHFTRPRAKAQALRPVESAPAPAGVAASAPPAPPAPQADPAPAPAVSHEQAEPTAPKTHGEHGKPADAPPAPAAVKGDRGQGHEKDPPAAPQPAPQPPASATEAPGNSGDHGRDAAPGQQDKGDSDKGGDGKGK